jgi:hypothetical protein
MLLATLTANLQASYADIQVQIEQLQEQQRLIQAQLQRVGSVESKMESAAALVAEAISEIREVCPDEIDNYRLTITSLFGGAPVAQLTPGADDITNEVEPQPAPAEPEIEEVWADEAPTVEAIEVAAVEVEPQPQIEAQQEVTDESPVEPYSNSIVTPQVLHRQKAKSLQWLATQKGIESADMKRHELAKVLTGQVTESELERAIRQAS